MGDLVKTILHKSRQRLAGCAIIMVIGAVFVPLGCKDKPRQPGGDRWDPPRKSPDFSWHDIDHAYLYYAARSTDPLAQDPEPIKAGVTLPQRPWSAIIVVTPKQEAKLLLIDSQRLVARESLAMLGRSNASSSRTKASGSAPAPQNGTPRLGVEQRLPPFSIDGNGCLRTLSPTGDWEQDKRAVPLFLASSGEEKTVLTASDVLYTDVLRTEPILVADPRAPAGAPPAIFENADFILTAEVAAAHGLPLSPDISANQTYAIQTLFRMIYPFTDGALPEAQLLAPATPPSSEAYKVALGKAQNTIRMLELLSQGFAADSFLRHQTIFQPSQTSATAGGSHGLEKNAYREVLIRLQPDGQNFTVGRTQLNFVWGTSPNGEAAPTELTMSSFRWRGNLTQDPSTWQGTLTIDAIPNSQQVVAKLISVLEDLDAGILANPANRDQLRQQALKALAAEPFAVVTQDQQVLLVTFGLPTPGGSYRDAVLASPMQVTRIPASIVKSFASDATLPQSGFPTTIKAAAVGGGQPMVSVDNRGQPIGLVNPAPASHVPVVSIGSPRDPGLAQKLLRALSPSKQR